MNHDAMMERFFTSLISGDRPEARQVIDEMIDHDCDTGGIISELYWPVLDHIQTQYREDNLSELSYHYATRLMRLLADQMQLRLEQKARRNRRGLMVCGNEAAEEIAAQLAADLLEADGYEVFFAGGGVAHDEIVAEVGKLNCDVLTLFGAVPASAPMARRLIDHLHEVGVCPKLQIVVGGGVFNRADGLAEEIGADLWAGDPLELVQVMNECPQRRMTGSQRTVGRKRRPASRVAAA